jgi:hypothetical protein
VTIICAWCGKIKQADGTWVWPSERRFADDHPRESHGICPTCAEQVQKNFPLD